MIGISSNRHVSCALGTRKLLAYSWSGSPTRGTILAFIGGKSCIAAAHLANITPASISCISAVSVADVEGATDRRRRGSPTDKWHRHAALCYGDAIASCKQLTATHQSLSLSLFKHVLQRRHQVTTYTHTYIHTPSSEKSDTFGFPYTVHSFRTNFMKPANISKWIDLYQLTVIWFWQNRLNIFCAVTQLWHFCKNHDSDVMK